MSASGDTRGGGGGGGGGGGARIVLVWADASGRWPSRGFFGAVSAVSAAPRAAYEAAHEHGDLSLGDAHLVDCGAAAPGLLVCLMPVLKRDKGAPPGTPPALCAASLDAALQKVAAAAVARRATVHSPRLAAAAAAAAQAARRGDHVRLLLPPSLSAEEGEGGAGRGGPSVRAESPAADSCGAVAGQAGTTATGPARRPVALRWRGRGRPCGTAGLGRRRASHGSPFCMPCCKLYVC
eukprot:6093908-Prymnesium_polylepis.1